MTRPHSLRKALSAGLAGLTLAACLSVAETAQADITPRIRLLDYTAYTLNQWETRIGLFELEFAPLDEVTFGTYLPPWVGYALTGEEMVNGYVKARVLQLGPLAVALRGTVFYVNADDITVRDIIENGSVKSWFVLPNMALSYAFTPDMYLSVEGTYLKTISSTKANVQSSSATGAGIHDNLQLNAQFEYDFSEHVAFTFLARWVPWASPLALESEVQVDPDTHVEADIAWETSNIKNAYALIPGVHLSWGVFHLQVGCGYGNIFIPGVGLVAPKKTVAPQFDIYARF